MPAPLSPGSHVILVMMSAVGDAVHALPVVTALKRHDPSLRLTWVLQPGPASLVRGHPDVDEILVFDRKAGLRGFAGIARQLRGRRFELVIDLQVYFKASVVTALARAPRKLGFDRARARDMNWLFTNERIPPHEPQHVQDQYLEFLDYLGVDPYPLEWNLGPWDDEREGQRELLSRWERPLAPLVIGTSDPLREWAPERWAELHDALIERYELQPLLVGGRSDRELQTARLIRENAGHPVESALGGSLRELVWILDGAAVVVSVNTAPLHMAVALGTPAVTLAGHWNPKRTGPYRFRDLIVDAYGEPGEDYPISIEKRPGTMERIAVADVLEKLDVWRRRYGAGADGLPDSSAEAG